MKKLTRKQTIIAIVAASLAVVLTVTFGCVFGITHTVTLDFGRFALIRSEGSTHYPGVIMRNPDRFPSTRTFKSHIYKQFQVPTDIVPTDYYEFVGWYKDYGRTIPWLGTDKITSDITLYAKWQKRNYPKL